MASLMIKVPLSYEGPLLADSHHTVDRIWDTRDATCNTIVTLILWVLPCIAIRSPFPIGFSPCFAPSHQRRRFAGHWKARIEPIPFALYVCIVWPYLQQTIPKSNIPTPVLSMENIINSTCLYLRELTTKQNKWILMERSKLHSIISKWHISPICIDLFWTPRTSVKNFFNITYIPIGLTYQLFLCLRNWIKVSQILDDNQRIYLSTMISACGCIKINIRNLNIAWYNYRSSLITREKTNTNNWREQQ